MKAALGIVMAVGIAIGFLFPTGPRTAPVAAAAAPAAATRVASGAPAPAPGGGDVPVDTVLDRGPQGHFLAVANVNNEPIRFVVDTGADMVALTVDDARRAHVAFDPATFQVVGRGASGDVRGQQVQIDSIVLDGKRATNVSAVVIDGADVSLLGHSYLRHLSDVQIKGDQMILHD